jgi:hypothetical protein
MICRMLTFVGNVDSFVSAWHTGQQLAALLGHPQLARVLIAQGAAVNGAAAGTPLPLQLASDAETILELLSGGAKMTALESHQWRRVICVLIKADADALSVTKIEDILHTSEDAAGLVQQLQADSRLCSSYSNTALAVSKQVQLAVEYLRQDSIAVEALGHCSTLMCEHRDAALPAFEYTLFYSSSSSSAVVDVSREQQADAVAQVQQLLQLEREKRLRAEDLVADQQQQHAAELGRAATRTVAVEAALAELKKEHTLELREQRAAVTDVRKDRDNAVKTSNDALRAAVVLKLMLDRTKACHKLTVAALAAVSGAALRLPQDHNNQQQQQQPAAAMSGAALRLPPHRNNHHHLQQQQQSVASSGEAAAIDLFLLALLRLAKSARGRKGRVTRVAAAAVPAAVAPVNDTVAAVQQQQAGGLEADEVNDNGGDAPLQQAAVAVQVQAGVAALAVTGGVVPAVPGPEEIEATANNNDQEAAVVAMGGIHAAAALVNANGNAPLVPHAPVAAIDAAPAELPLLQPLNAGGAAVAAVGGAAPAGGAAAAVLAALGAQPAAAVEGGVVAAAAAVETDADKVQRLTAELKSAERSSRQRRIEVGA